MTSDPFQECQDGKTRAHITWLDDEGLQHFCVAWTEASALDKLADVEAGVSDTLTVLVRR